MLASPSRPILAGGLAVLRPVPRLREFRELAVLSQRELAGLAHVAEASVRRIEHGYPARQTTIRKLAAALGVKPRELMAPAE